ncbi:hypothetical protein Trisim1_003555 [Trichoderma cf. simile WF8]
MSDSSDYSDSSETSSESEEEFEGRSWRQEIESERQKIDIVVIHGIEGQNQPSSNPEKAKHLQDLLSHRIREIRAKITFRV